MIDAIRKDPFKILFPVAVTLALYACMVWILHSFFQIGEYPNQLHARLFIGGYLYLTIIGFLMTAIPKFTKTPIASLSDVIFIVFNSIMIWLSILTDNELMFWLIVSLGLSHLLIFLLIRFKTRKQNPPFTFIFVGLGLVLGLLGANSLLISNLYNFELMDIQLIGKALFYDGMILSLLLGIGGRLIPGILGHKDTVIAQREKYEKNESFSSVIPMSIYVLAILFIISFVMEIYLFSIIAYTLRAIVITYVAIKYWNIHKRMVQIKANNLILRLSCFILLIGSWLLALLPHYTIDIKHLIYIGAYSLITFLVSARVTLAHCSDNLDLEKKHFPFSFFGGLLIFAALTRATAILIPNSYLNHLGYTASLYLIALIIWVIVFIPKIIKHF